MGFGTYIMPALKKFRQDHPNIKVRFHSALTDGIVKMLQSGAVDLAILFSPFEPDEAMETHVIDVIEEYLVAGPKYAHLADKENMLIDLRDYPFISLPEGSAGKEYMTRWFQKYGLTFEPDIEVTTVDLVVQAAMDNFGISILPRGVVESSAKRRGGGLFHLLLSEKLPERPVFAITNRMLPISVAAQTFIKEYLQKP
jgi:DNA-binding transcriptional LysR family regulator